MPLTDSHMHLFAAGYPGKYGPLFPNGSELATYEAIRRVHHIERALVVGYEGEPWAHGNNRYVARLARQHSWITPLAFCSLAKPISRRQLLTLWQEGFRGISIYLSDASDVTKLLAWPDDALTTLNDKRAIISINAPLPQIAPLRRFFERLPATSILLSHLGLPGHVSAPLSKTAARRLLAPLLEQADLPQVGVKLSALYACNDFPHRNLTGIFELITQQFGEMRLYWGSDFSPALDEVTFTHTIEAVRQLLGRLTDSKAIFRGNLDRIANRVR